jgi:hypothetical protein
VRVTLLLLLSVALAGCGARGRPTPIPGDLGQVINALVLRGATITAQVSGDAGCSVPDLRNNAIRYDVLMPDETAAAPVYVFNWYRPTDFEAGASSFDQCVSEHRAAHPASDVATVASPPWRAYGRDWSPALRTAVDEALRAH